jgi:hypothetical protein
LAPALPALLFFLIFYSLFGPFLARPFIFPYLLLFIWPLPFPHGPAPCPALPCPALQDRRTDRPCPTPCPALPCLAARFSESGFLNPTVRAGSTASIKTRNRRRTHSQTHTHVVIIYSPPLLAHTVLP